MYKIVEIDANDKKHDVRSNLSRSEATAKVKLLRKAYGKYGLRYEVANEN